MKRFYSVLLACTFLGFMFAGPQAAAQGRCSVDVEVEETPNGYVLTAVAKGEAPFKYEWSNGETTEQIRVEKEGLYCVAVYDANRCAARACAKVGETGGGGCTVKISVERMRTGSNIILRANARGAGAGLTYEWSTGETTETIEVDPSVAGKYCVTITDDAGCKAEDCFEVKGETDRCAVRIKMDRDLTGGIVLSAYAVGEAPFKYEWSTGETTARITVDKDGEYCVSITDANGCESKACIEVRTPNNDRCAVKITVSKRDAVGTAVLTANAKGQAPFKYEWSNGETTESIKVDTPGTYCVTITDNAGCTSRDCIRYTDRAPKCKVAIKATRNGDSTITLTAHIRGGAGSYKYEWSTGETTQSIVIKGAGEYCVVINDGMGCEAKACFRLRESKGKRDSCGVKIQKIIDRGGRGVILIARGFGTPRLSYEWDNGETTQRILVDEKGTYCVKITDGKGCEAKACVDVEELGGGGAPSFKVFPNPFEDRIVVAWEVDQLTQVDYTITDVRGNVKLSGSWNEKGQVEKTIDGSQLPSGLYYLNLVTPQGTENIRIFKR